MIYLDVTSTCKSPLNTGVPRTVRGLLKALSPFPPITPILWDNALGSYCRLSKREARLLASEPTRPLPNWMRNFQHRFNRFNLASALGPQDAFIVPEIFQDWRIEFLQNLKTDAILAAIFHDAIAWTHSPLTAPERRPRFTDYLTTLNRFNLVTCVSHEAEADLKKFWSSSSLQSAPTRVLSWPTDFPEVPRGTTGNFSAKRILCVSSLEPRKNHLPLLDAADLLWERNTRFELMLVGKDCEEGGPRVRQKLQKLQERGHPIRWLQQVDDDLLHEEYQKCSFTVYPSIKEGFGLPILESLWHARPSLCGNSGAIAETATGGGCLCVDTSSVQALADGILTLLSISEKYEELTQEAIRRKFPTWNDYGQEFLK